MLIHSLVLAPVASFCSFASGKGVDGMMMGKDPGMMVTGNDPAPGTMMIGMKTKAPTPTPMPSPTLETFVYTLEVNVGGDFNCAAWGCQITVAYITSEGLPSAVTYNHSTSCDTINSALLISTRVECLYVDQDRGPASLLIKQNDVNILRCDDCDLYSC